MCVCLSSATGSVIFFVHCCSVSSYRVLVLGLVSRKGYTAQVHIPFGYTIQSTAGLGIVSVHKSHHYKHSQPHNKTLPWGFAVLHTGMGISLATAFKRNENESTSFSVLNSTELKFLHSLGPFTRKKKQVSAV